MIQSGKELPMTIYSKGYTRLKVMRACAHMCAHIQIVQIELITKESKAMINTGLRRMDALSWASLGVVVRGFEGCLMIPLKILAFILCRGSILICYILTILTYS